MGANYLDSIREIKKGGNYLPPFYSLAKFILRCGLIVGVAVNKQWF